MSFVPWAQATDLPPEAVAGQDPAALAAACLASSVILHDLSGQQFGPMASVVLRPTGATVCGCGALAAFSTGDGWWIEGWSTGQPASVFSRTRLRLPERSTVTAVKVDGVTLAGSEWSVLDGRWLVRGVNAFGQRLLWPCCQREDLADTEAGTWSVTLTHGQLVDATAKMMAVALALDILPLVPGSTSKCKSGLDAKVVQTVTQGTTRQFTSSKDLLGSAKLTGNRLVDTWLVAVNPAGARSRPVIASPDTVLLARRTSS